MSGPKDISLTARYTAAAWEHLKLPHASRFVDWRGRALFYGSLAGGAVLPGRIGHQLLIGGLAPRHLFMDEWIRKNGFRQVVEVAAGYSPRGLMFAEEGIRYIEVDRPHVMAEKERLSAGAKKRPTFLGVDATAPDFVDRVVAACDPNLKTALINEGMSMYFSRNEYIGVLKNFKQLAQRLNAVLLTDFLRDASGGKLAARMLDTGRLAVWLVADKVYTYAKNEQEVRSVFEEAGWEVVAVHYPAKDPKYTLGKPAAVKNWLHVVEARPLILP